MLRRGWKLGGTLLGVALAWTAYEALPPPWLPRAVLPELGAVRMPLPRLGVRHRGRVRPRTGAPRDGPLRTPSRQRRAGGRHRQALPRPRPRQAGLPHPAARPSLHQELTMPRRAREPAAFEPQWLQRSLDRHYTWGLVFMVILILGFVLYGIREPTLRANAAHEQQATYARLGDGLFANNCAAC